MVRPHRLTFGRSKRLSGSHGFVKKAILMRGLRDKSASNLKISRLNITFYRFRALKIRKCTYHIYRNVDYQAFPSMTFPGPLEWSSVPPLSTPRSTPNGCFRCHRGCSGDPLGWANPFCICVWRTLGAGLKVFGSLFGAVFERWKK